MYKTKTTHVLSLVKVNKILQKLDIEKANEPEGVLKRAVVVQIISAIIYDSRLSSGRECTPSHGRIRQKTGVIYHYQAKHQ